MKNLSDKPGSSNILGKQDLEQVKSLHRRSGNRVAEYLARQGGLGQAEMMEFLCEQLRIARYTPEEFPFDPVLKSVLSAELALRHHAAPLKKDRELLYVATYNPLDINLLEALERGTNLEIEPVYCAKPALRKLLLSYYGVSLDLGEGQDEPAKLRSTLEPGEFLEPADPSEVQGQAVPYLNKILAQAARERASHLHIGARSGQLSVQLRGEDGLSNSPVPPGLGLAPLVSRVKQLCGMDISLKTQQHGHFSYKVGQTEVSVSGLAANCLSGEILTLRFYYKTLSPEFELSELGLEAGWLGRVEAFLGKRQGALFISGPAKSGRSSLYYALLGSKELSGAKVLSLEQQIESVLARADQVQFSPRQGQSYAGQLAMLSELDPDLLACSDIDASGAARAGLEAALSGQGFLGSLCSASAAGALSRLLDHGVSPYLLASTFRLSLNLRLAWRNCPDCLEPYYPSPELLARAGQAFAAVPGFMRSSGCPACAFSGHKGRVGFQEFLAVDAGVREQILAKATHLELTKAAAAGGNYRCFAEDAAQKAAAGLVSLEEALTRLDL